MLRQLQLQMTRSAADIKAGLWRRKGHMRSGYRLGLRSGSRPGNWGLHDTYFFISRFFLPPAVENGSSAVYFGSTLIGPRGTTSSSLFAGQATARFGCLTPYIDGRFNKAKIRTHQGIRWLSGQAMSEFLFNLSLLPHEPARETGNPALHVQLFNEKLYRKSAWGSQRSNGNSMVHGLDSVNSPLFTSSSIKRIVSAIGMEGRMPVGAEQRRWFRDYFTAHLPGSSLHPDPPPLKTTSKLKDGANDRTTTTVRIPLRSAKHHFGAARARGTRPRNEDNYQAGVIDLPPFSPMQNDHQAIDEENVPGQEPAVFYFSVFDGHGGEDASLFLKEHLHHYIEESSKLLNPESTALDAVLEESEVATKYEGSDVEKGREHRIDLQNQLVNMWKDTVGGYFRRFRPDFGGIKGCRSSGDGGIEAVLTYAFLKADLDFITRRRPWFLPPAEEESSTNTQADSKEPSNPFKGGSTATLVLISTSSPKPFWNPQQTSTLVTAHLGDTRALLCRVSDGLVVPLTSNHHPGSPSETARLRRYATAFVSDAFGEERFGVLANTRAIGDVNQKRLGVSAEPDLVVKQILPGEYSFLVLVSDGVTAVLGDQEIADIVKECKTPEEASKDLVDFVDEVGDVGDNATALVVRLGGWEKRSAGGDGWIGTKALREWRRGDAEERGNRSRRM